MKKREKKPKEEPPCEPEQSEEYMRFEEFARKLMAVPKQEIVEPQKSDEDEESVLGQP